MPEPVIIAVPPKGGTLDDVMRRLVSLNWLDTDVVAGIRYWIKQDKKRIKLEERLIELWSLYKGDEAAIQKEVGNDGLEEDIVNAALKRLRRVIRADGTHGVTFASKMDVDAILNTWRSHEDPALAEAAKMLHLELDLSRYGRPTRMMFDHMEFEFEGVRGVLVGTEHETTPTYLRRHKRDISLTCYDAFQSTLLDALDTGKVHNWQELMDHLIEANTDVRILGSFGLNDYLGHFVLMPEERAKRTISPGGNRAWNNEDDDPKLSVLSEDPVLIDSAYEGMYMNLLDAEAHGITFEHTTNDIERLCAEEGRTSIYIVQSGGTIARTPGLCVVGEELVRSETIIAVNEERMDHSPGMRQLIESLQPNAEDGSQVWHEKLKQRLGDKLF